MADFPFKINCEDGKYTSVLLSPYQNTGYFGTSHGCVEIWDLDKRVKLTEVRYLLLNNFNEPIPVNEPVVNLAAPQDFNFVYAFMGIAAYCIDTTLRQIVQQIPVSEKVVFGSVSPERGEIGVLAETGYLSRWSPKFVERTGSLEFNKLIPKAFLTHDNDESRVILVLPEGKVLLTNLEGERYTEEFEIEDGPQYVVPNRYDRNAFSQVYIESDGSISMFEPKHIIDSVKETVYRHGILEASEYLRKKIDLLEKKGVERKYIPDVRFERKSHDRYNAEVDSIGKELHHPTNESDDSKTLDYALDTYSTGDYTTKSEAQVVIKRMSDRYGIEPKYVQIAWKSRPDPTKLVSLSRHLQEMSQRREEQLRYISYIYYPILLFTLIIGLSTLNPTLATFVLLILVVITMLLIFYSNTINHNPHFVWIREYKALRMITLILPFGFILNIALSSQI